MEAKHGDADKKSAVWKQNKGMLTRRQLCGSKTRGCRQEVSCVEAKQGDADKKSAVWKQNKGKSTRRQLCGSKTRGC